MKRATHILEWSLVPGPLHPEHALTLTYPRVGLATASEGPWYLGSKLIGGGHLEQLLRMYIAAIWAMPHHGSTVAAPILHVVILWMLEGLIERGNFAIAEPFVSRMVGTSDAARRLE